MAGMPRTGAKSSRTGSSFWARGLVAILMWIAMRGAFAYQAAYEGFLMSTDLADAPIPILLTLEVNLAGVSGEVKTGMPMAGQGRLSGSEAFGRCELRTDIGAAVVTMNGACGPSLSTFEGTYVLKPDGEKPQAGTFTLQRTSQPGGAAGRGSSAVGRPSTASGSSAALPLRRCSREQISCLTACPRGDYAVERACVDECNRLKLACTNRAKRGGLPPSSPAPRGTPASTPLPRPR